MKAKAAEEDVAWTPFPGPQTLALASQADELFYGGAAGGGKTDLLLGAALTRHQRSIIFRREFKQLEGLRERSEEIYHPYGRFNGSKELWRLRYKNRPIHVEFGAVQLLGHEKKYQGRAHDLKCVARGTPVVMADGSCKPIEDLQVGDLVQTLEGGRRVTRLIPMRQDAGVRITAKDCHGTIIAEQVQSLTHSVLTNAGWIAFDELPRPCSCGSTESGSFARCAEPTRCLYQGLPLFHGTQSRIVQPSRGRDRQATVHRVSPATFVFSGAEVRETGCEGSSYPLEGDERHLSTTDLREPAQPGLQLSWLDSVRDLSGRDERYAPVESLPLDYLDGCSSGIRLYDERPRKADRHGFEQAADRVCPLLLADVGRPSPNCFEDGVRGKTPTRNHLGRMYVHPYTKQIRQAAEDIREFDWSYTLCGEVELFDIEVDEVNHYITTGGFINKNCFDEITHLAKSQYDFLKGWNRTADPAQRSRIICAGNPPTDAEGDWVIAHWAPWLDPSHPNPALPGELRWFATIKGKDVELEHGLPFFITGEADAIQPKSRTFIRAKVQDNPFYMESGYLSTLQAMPEPLRSQMLLGDFGAGRQDDERQVIPTDWVLAAQARWTPEAPTPWCDAIGVDVARGGKDKTVLTPRHGIWFGEQSVHSGTTTPDGWAALQFIIQIIPSGQRPQIKIDGIGVGSSVYDLAIGQGLDVHALIASETSYERDKAGVLGYFNKRADWWWTLREALDPLTGDDLAIPPDRELRADLTAARWKPTVRGIQIESKDDIIERIGRSPDKGESLVYAHAEPTRAPRTHLI